MIVGTSREHVGQPGKYHGGGAHEHAVIAVPRILWGSRPHHINDGANTVQKSETIDGQPPQAQAENTGRLPSLQAGNERTQHEHLKGDIDAGRGEADDGSNRILQPQSAQGDESRDESGDEKRANGYMGLWRNSTEQFASGDHLIATIGK